MMDLKEAIEEVKLRHDGVDYAASDFQSLYDSLDYAIATILNAVAKGELRHDNDR